MYFDIYIPIAWKRIDDPGKDAANGVHLEGPAKLRAVMYAAVEHGTVWHCLVTAPQLAQLKKDAIPFVHFSALAAIEKLTGCPRHVFGHQCVEPGATADEVKIYKPGKAEPEIVRGTTA